MRTNIPKLLTIYMMLLIAVCAFSSRAVGQELSSISGSFIDIGYGTRASGIGFAYTGLAEGPDASIWNPAGLAQSSKMEFSAMYTKQFDLVDYNYVSGVIPLKNTPHKFGFALTTSGDEVLREYALSVGYAYNMGKLKLGSNLKVRLNTFGNNTLSPDDFVVFDPDEITTGISNQIQGEGFGIGADLGALYSLSKNLQFGLLLRDVFAPFWWSSETRNNDGNGSNSSSYEEGIPFRAVIGGAYKYKDHIIIVTDYLPALQDEQSDVLRAGIEKQFVDVISIRAGTEQQIRAENIDQYTVGFGLKSPSIAGFILKAEYAYVMNELTDSHRIGIQIVIN